jgi:hypothetical protein
LRELSQNDPGSLRERSGLFNRDGSSGYSGGDGRSRYREDRAVNQLVPTDEHEAEIYGSALVDELRGMV